MQSVVTFDMQRRTQAADDRSAPPTTFEDALEMFDAPAEGESRRCDCGDCLECGAPEADQLIHHESVSVSGDGMHESETLSKDQKPAGKDDWEAADADEAPVTFTDAEWREHAFKACSGIFLHTGKVFLWCYGISILLAIDRSDLTSSLRKSLGSNGYLPEPELIGQQLAGLHIYLPFVVCCFCFYICRHFHLFNSRTYFEVVAATAIGLQLSTGMSAHVAQISEVLSGESNAPSHCAPHTTADAAPNADTCSAFSSPAQTALIETILRRAAFHVGQALTSTAMISFFLPEPKWALAVMLAVGTTNIARAQYLWRTLYGINLLAATWPFHATSTALGVAACSMHQRLLRQQLLMHKTAEHAKDVRIEQLAREKERLNYERAFALKRPPSEESTTPLHAVGRHPHEHTYGHDDHAYGHDHAYANQGFSLSSGDHGDQSGSLASDGSPAGASPSGAPTNATHTSHPHDSLIRLPRAARPSGPSVAHDETSQVTGATDSEIVEIFAGRAERAAPPYTDHGPPQPLPLPVGVYPLLPQYAYEYHDQTLVWLRAGAERAPHVLRVVDGLLCGHDGVPLGSGSGQGSGDSHGESGCATYIFVVDAATGGMAAPVLVAEKQPYAGRAAGSGDERTTSMHHSSLVAGGAVLAAGEFTACNGLLRSLSNWSGHYAPPPSCLHAFLGRVAAMGAHGLQHVSIETVGSCRGRRKVAAGGGMRGYAAPSDADVSSVLSATTGTATSVYDPAQAMRSG